MRRILALLSIAAVTAVLAGLQADLIVARSR